MFTKTIKAIDDLCAAVIEVPARLLMKGSSSKVLMTLGALAASYLVATQSGLEGAALVTGTLAPVLTGGTDVVTRQRQNVADVKARASIANYASTTKKDKSSRQLSSIDNRIEKVGEEPNKQLTRFEKCVKDSESTSNPYINSVKQPGSPVIDPHWEPLNIQKVMDECDSDARDPIQAEILLLEKMQSVGYYNTAPHEGRLYDAMAWHNAHLSMLKKAWDYVIGHEIPFPKRAQIQNYRKYIGDLNSKLTEVYGCGVKKVNRPLIWRIREHFEHVEVLNTLWKNGVRWDQVQPIHNNPYCLGEFGMGFVQ